MSLPLLLLAASISAPEAEAAPAAPKPLIVATRVAPPFSMKEDDEWVGLTHLALGLLARQEGFSYELKEMGLQEMLDAVAAGEVDVAAAALTITAEREARVDFTHPINSSGIGLAVRETGALDRGFDTLRRVFSGAFARASGGLLVLLALVGAGMWAFERKANAGHFPRKPLKGIGAGIWWSAVTMTTVGYGDKAPVTLAGRLLGLVWMFASIIVISGFTAAIASSLTVGELEQRVRGLSDLHGKKVLTVKDSSSARFLDEKGVKFKGVDDIKVALEALSEGSADAVLYDIPILRYWAAQIGSDTVRVLPERLRRQSYGIALPSGSPLRERFNRRILELHASPRWERALESAFGPPGAE